MYSHAKRITKSDKFPDIVGEVISLVLLKIVERAND